MHARMTHSLTARHDRHDRRMSSQAAAGQWSSHAVDFYDWTSRGPLELMLVDTAVQWFASLWCVRRPRGITRWTSHSACEARAERGQRLRLTNVAMMEDERGDAQFACAACHWYRRQASWSLEVRHAWHACTPHGADVHVASCARRPWKYSGSHTASKAMAGQVVASCSWSWCMVLCNGSLRFCAYDERERSLYGPHVACM